MTFKRMSLSDLLGSDDEGMQTKDKVRGVTTATKNTTTVINAPSTPLTGTSKRKATTITAVEMFSDEETDTALITPPKSKKRKTANATAAGKSVVQTPTKATPTAQPTAAKATNGVPKGTPSAPYGKSSSRVADEIKGEDGDTYFAQKDVAPIAIEPQADKQQELSETNRQARKDNANAKSVESATKLVDSNSKLVRRNAELLGRPSVVEAVERERLLDQREAELEVNEKAAAERLDREGKQLWRERQQIRYWEVQFQARVAKHDNAPVVQREATQPSVYDTQDLDIYKTDRVSQLPADDPLAKQLVRLWERKVAAVLGNKPFSKHVKIPEAVTQSSWRNHPIVHCFGELDRVWQYLDNVAETCQHLVHGKHPLLLFADQMRNFPVVDAELWLLRADNVLQKLAERFEADEIESRVGCIPHGPSTSQGRRQRRFRALKREEALSILAGGGDPSKKYRLAKFQAENFAIQEGFDEVL
nr:hypothetical protein B0A51_07276 [Rachicladosporium sp. CCFEE 5018]